MSGDKPRRHLVTGIVALVLLATGFMGGACASAWSVRDARVFAWRKIRVEHEGVEGITTRTRLFFENLKVPLRSVEVVRGPKGVPERARIVSRSGVDLTMRYDSKARPLEVVGPNGNRAKLNYKGRRARVTFVSANGTQVGNKVLRVPVELRPALHLAHADGGLSLIGTAYAQTAENKKTAPREDEDIRTKREIVVVLDITLAQQKHTGPTKTAAGSAQIEATCAPFVCVPITSDVAMPGQTRFRIAVSGSVKKNSLKAPAGQSALKSFKKYARAERGAAQNVMNDIGGVIGAVGVTAAACRSLKLTWPVCMSAFTTKAAGAAIIGASSHTVRTTGPAIDHRATALYYQDQARAALSRQIKIRICATRDGYTRGCVKAEGDPFGRTPLPIIKGAITLRPGLTGDILGQFVLTQADGPDCQFSPSPKTTGPLRLSFDNKRGVLLAKLKSNARGTRYGLRCSAGSATMAWSQIYSATVEQTVTNAQLQKGGRLPLRMTGTMSGSGSYSFSGCVSPGGVSGRCPAGKSETYAYALQLIGHLNLDTQKGSGNLVVTGPRLPTSGTWRAPKDAKP